MSFFENTRKPVGLGGKIMVAMMNLGHSPVARWGLRFVELTLDAKVLDYIHEGQIEAFEGFEDFDLIAFDWYDVRSERTAASQMLLYLDREDLFVFCEDDAAEDAAQAALLVPEEEALSNEQVLHRFFVRLLRGDMAHLDRLEADISDGETEVLTGAHEAYLDRIIAWRQELLRLKRYYETLPEVVPRFRWKCIVTVMNTCKKNCWRVQWENLFLYTF